MSCPRVSIASATMACSPMPPARRISNVPANCSASHRPLLPMRLSNRTTSGRHAHAAAGAWSSSKPSSAGASPAHHRLVHHYPGCRRRDPARPEGNIPRNAGACGDDVIRADRRQRGNHNQQSPATRTGEPVTPAWNRPVRTQARARVRRVAGHRSRTKTENPIAHRLWPAGSGFQDFRTPAGIQNSSGKRPVRF